MKIKSIKKIKPRKVYAIKTSTETFIADGLAHHNCSYCNVILKGNPIQYFLFMKSLGYSDEQLKEFDNLKHQIKPMSANDYKEIYERYKSWMTN